MTLLFVRCPNINKNPYENNAETFEKWIRQIWMYANTWSIDTYNSDSVAIKDMKPGDFFIQSNI